MLLNRVCSIQMQSLQIQSSILPICRISIDCTDYHSIGMQHSSYHAGLTKNAPISFFRLCLSARRLNPLAVFPVNVVSHKNMLIDLDFDVHSIVRLRYEESENEESKLLFDSDDSASCPVDEARETERRRKIGLANKGRTPWNKGRPHTLETRARIKERTIEAMRNPKVRRKMSKSPRRHSDQVKTKISSSLRQLWGERLKCKRAKEKLYRSWVENIAEAARKGGINEDELRWDSYGKMEREIALQILEHATEKANAKERKRTRAGRKAPIKSERKEALIKRPRKKRQIPEEVKEEPNLKARLTKIQRKRCVTGTASSQMSAVVSCYPSLERLDLQYMEREKIRMKVSLADEIQAAKSRRNSSIAVKT